MGLIYNTYLNAHRIYGCTKCSTHLSTPDEVVSKEFRGQHGTAYLFRLVVNVDEGTPVNRTMTTGMHTVRDIFCCKCHALLGWKYDKAFVAREKYKEGMFILEKALLNEVS